MTGIAHKRLQFKSDGIDEQGIFEGHASVWDIVDTEDDVVERGAFARTISEGLAKSGVPILVLHNDQWLPVGRSLELREDDVGLYIKGRISPTSMGNDVRILIRDGVLDELSIGYVPIRHEMREGKRHLFEVELPEISVVIWAANSAAKITGYKGGTPVATELPAAEPQKSTEELLEDMRALVAHLTELGVEIPWEELEQLNELEDDYLEIED